MGNTLSTLCRTCCEQFANAFCHEKRQIRNDCDYRRMGKAITLSCAAPAKLNLFLHVVGRRSDGYHLLQSLFVLIDWCDTLHFERRNDGRLARHDLVEPLPADDLCLRAARALQAESG